MVRDQLRAWLPEYRPADDTSRDVVVPFDRLSRGQSQGDAMRQGGPGRTGDVAGGRDAGNHPIKL